MGEIIPGPWSREENELEKRKKAANDNEAFPRAAQSVEPELPGALTLREEIDIGQLLGECRGTYQFYLKTCGAAARTSAERRITPKQKNLEELLKVFYHPLFKEDFVIVYEELWRRYHG